jgi:hypothetical protein
LVGETGVPRENHCNTIFFKNIWNEIVLTLIRRKNSNSLYKYYSGVAFLQFYYFVFQCICVYSLFCVYCYCGFFNATSTAFQFQVPVYHDGQFYWWRKPDYLKKSYKYYSVLFRFFCGFIISFFNVYMCLVSIMIAKKFQ